MTNFSKPTMATAALLLAAAGCTQEMVDQPRLEPLEASAFFADGRGSRAAVPGTVPRGVVNYGQPFFTGSEDGRPIDRLPVDPASEQPIALTTELVERGRQRFDIFCSVCHGRTGQGDGMVVRRGFTPPPSLHQQRLREETPLGHYFEVITNGFKTMPPFGNRIPARDRWAIAAYIRALQLSQHAALDDVSQDLPADIRQRFEAEANE